MTPKELQSSQVIKQQSKTPNKKAHSRFTNQLHSSYQQLRIIEDHIFQESQEAWEVLNTPDSIRVDGKTYQEIHHCHELTQTLERVRANAPIYQNWNTRKKKLFFSHLASDYNNKLKEKTNEPEEIKSSENISETLETLQTEMISVKKSGKKISKNWRNYQTPLKKNSFSNDCQVSCELQSRTPKKVGFLEESVFKYFSKAEPSEIIEAELQYSCLTFDKK